MTSIAQPPYDIDSDPFIVTGKEIINSLKLQVGTSSVPRIENDTQHIAYDSYYLYFAAEPFVPIYFDFLIKAFADKKECHPPVRITMGGKEYVSTFYKQHFRIVDEKPTPHFWGKEDTLKEKAYIKGFLEEYLYQFFYDYLTF